MSITQQLQAKCATQPLETLISGYTLVRMIKQPSTNQMLAMVAVGNEIEAREGEPFLDHLMDEIDALKYQRVN